MLGEWSYRTLGQVCHISSGERPPALGGEIPVMGANGPIASTKSSNFGRGFLVGRVGAAGAINEVRSPVWVSDNALTLRPRDAEVDWDFFGHLLRFLRPETLATKNAQPLVTQTNVSKLGTLLPQRIPEQRRIAEILDTLDEAIRKTEQVIKKLQQMKQGLLHDLLTRGINEHGELRDPQRHPEQFKDSPMGRIPKEWEVRTLESWVHPEAQVTYGIVQAGPHQAGGVPYIRTGDMKGKRLVREGLLCTSRAIASSYRRSEVRAGDLVYAIRATVGKVLPVPSELDGANLTQGTARVSPGPDVGGRFLLWALRSESAIRQVEAVQKGTTFSEITLAQLRLLKVACPNSKIEQQSISGRLDGIDQREDEEQRELTKLRTLKQGLMDDLLTGRVRVNVEEGSA